MRALQLPDVVTVASNLVTISRDDGIQLHTAQEPEGALDAALVRAFRGAGFTVEGDAVDVSPPLLGIAEGHIPIYDLALVRCRSLAKPHADELKRGSAPDARGDGTVVQTFILDKARFKDASAARAWLEENDARSPSLDEKDETWRARQYDPASFEPGSLRTIDITDGVKAVIGQPKKKAVRSVARSADEKRVIYYLDIEPDTPDTWGWTFSEDEIAEAAWRLAENGLGAVKIEHEKDISQHAHVVEFYIMPVEVPPGGLFHKVPQADGIPYGSLVIAIRYSPELWPSMRDTEHGISLRGDGYSFEKEV